MTWHWIPRILKTTWKWRVRWRKGNSTKWPGSTSVWICGRAAKTYMLHRRKFELKTNKWQRQDTFPILKRSSKHPSQTVNMMVWLHLNFLSDHICHQHYLQRSSVEDKLKYWMTAESEKLTDIQTKVMRTANMKTFWTPKIGLTGLGTWIIQTTLKMTGRPTINPT